MGPRRAAAPSIVSPAPSSSSATADLGFDNRRGACEEVEDIDLPRFPRPSASTTRTRRLAATAMAARTRRLCSTCSSAARGRQASSSPTSVEGVRRAAAVLGELAGRAAGAVADAVTDRAGPGGGGGRGVEGEADRAALKVAMNLFSRRRVRSREKRGSLLHRCRVVIF